MHKYASQSSRIYFDGAAAVGKAVGYAPVGKAVGKTPLERPVPCGRGWLVFEAFLATLVLNPVANPPVGNEPVGNEPVGNEPVGNEPVGKTPEPDLRVLLWRVCELAALLTISPLLNPPKPVG